MNAVLSKLTNVYAVSAFQHRTEFILCLVKELTLKVLVTTIDAQWEGMGDVGSARY